MKYRVRLKSWLNPKRWFEGESKPAEQMGLGIGFVLFGLAIIAFVRGNYTRAENLSLLASLLAGGAIIYPRLLLPMEKILRNLLMGVAWLNTKLMLILVYYLIFTPTGLLLRLFGKKLIEKEFRTAQPTYFERREESEYKPERDELQY